MYDLQVPLVVNSRVEVKSQMGVKPVADSAKRLVLNVDDPVHVVERR
jgi:hypothetical protein